jgi:hypothetical protein
MQAINYYAEIRAIVVLLLVDIILLQHNYICLSEAVALYIIESDIQWYKGLGNRITKCV